MTMEERPASLIAACTARLFWILLAEFFLLLAFQMPDCCSVLRLLYLVAIRLSWTTLSSHESDVLSAKVAVLAVWRAERERHKKTCKAEKEETVYGLKIVYCTLKARNALILTGYFSLPAWRDLHLGSHRSVSLWHFYALKNVLSELCFRYDLVTRLLIDCKQVTRSWAVGLRGMLS